VGPENNNEGVVLGLRLFDRVVLGLSVLDDVGRHSPHAVRDDGPRGAGASGILLAVPLVRCLLCCIFPINGSAPLIHTLGTHLACAVHIISFFEVGSFIWRATARL
jgi:hypothetical protein